MTGKANKRTTAEAPARISLSIKDGPCRCREPLMDSAVEARREIALDLRGIDSTGQIAPVLRSAWNLREKEYLRVHIRAISHPLLAAIQSAGHRFQIVARRDSHVEMLVWQFLTPEQRQRYLRDGIDMESVTASPARN